MKFNQSEVNTIGYAISRALSEFDSNNPDDVLVFDALTALEDKVSEALTA